MTQVEILSPAAASDFAEQWYEIAADEHFWIRWRFNFFLREIRRLRLPLTRPLAGLDIGCGHGAVQRQLATQTAWRTDGCDLNREALNLRADRPGRILYYDINDRRPELRERYDFLVLFDVIEHIDITRPFIEAALYHLRPGGYVFVDVPAGQSCFSRFDQAVGHRRRYNRKLLATHLAEAGLGILSMNYWGWSLLPALIARKLYLDLDSTRALADVVRTGLRPPGRLTAALLSSALALESLFPPAPLGTSLLAVARKP